MDVEIVRDASVVPTRYWHRLEDGRIQCDLCPRECNLKTGDRGFCFVRENRDGEMVLTTYGRLDIACNSAALSRGSGRIHDYDREVFEETLEMCLTNTWLCMKYEIPAMLEGGGGAIVNISSNASLKGQPFNTAYAAAKGGLNARIRWLGEGFRPVGEVITEKLLPLANAGLKAQGVEGSDITYYLGIIEERVRSGRNGATWQREYAARHGREWPSLLSSYFRQQEGDIPVHAWEI